VRRECTEADSSGRQATQSNNVVLHRYCKGFDLKHGTPVRVARFIGGGEIVHSGRCAPL
jgi:hypothetical protein